MAKAKTGAGGGRAKLITATKEAALAEQKKKLKALEALIRRRLVTVVEASTTWAEALAEVLRRKLYAAAGHASLEAWLRATRLLSVTQAMKLLAVVRHVPREQALAAGQERAYALIALASATPEPDTAAGLIEGGPSTDSPRRRRQ
nr:hypothetical protein [Deltaproteobacteria bacterium]